MWMGPVLPLAIKLVAFGEVALIQLGKGSTHPTVNSRRGRIVLRYQPGSRAHNEYNQSANQAHTTAGTK
jgi:hypothetical protein